MYESATIETRRIEYEVGECFKLQINKIKGPQTDQLFEAILSLESLEDCYQFFDDLCTLSEIQSLAQRLDVAIMLQNQKTYDLIQKETGASTATISRVRRCVDYGSGGYEAIKDYFDQKNK